MGHVVFIVLHLIALLLGAVFLFVTIPMHLVYCAVGGTKRDPDRPTPDTHVRCPDCKELVLKEANVCKHCHCKLMPQG
jgi:hypothetical protein